MNREQYARELLNYSLVEKFIDLSYSMDAPFKFGFFDFKNRRGSSVGDVPGVEVTLKKEKAEKEVLQFLQVANFYNVKLTDIKESDDDKTFTFVDPKQIKYYKII